jgi:hypothetical protein
MPAERWLADARREAAAARAPQVWEALEPGDAHPQRRRETAVVGPKGPDPDGAPWAAVWPPAEPDGQAALAPVWAAVARRAPLVVPVADPSAAVTARVRRVADGSAMPAARVLQPGPSLLR